MSNKQQRQVNGERAKARFSADVERELDRLDAALDEQKRSQFPRKIRVTQASVAKAAGGYHRTTFRGTYHNALRERLKRIAARARDPKGTMVQNAPSVKSITKSAGFAGESSRLRELQMQRVDDENRLLRRRVLELEKRQSRTLDASSPFAWSHSTESVSFKFGPVP